MKTFCPNCEKDTDCTHEAELYACNECGEDFAKYIVSRKQANTDVSDTQNVIRKLREVSNMLYLLLSDNPETKLLADKALIEIYGKEE